MTTRELIDKTEELFNNFEKSIESSIIEIIGSLTEEEISKINIDFIDPSDFRIRKAMIGINNGNIEVMIDDGLLKDLRDASLAQKMMICKKLVNILETQNIVV